MSNESWLQLPSASATSSSLSSDLNQQSSISSNIFNQPSLRSSDIFNQPSLRPSDIFNEPLVVNLPPESYDVIPSDEAANYIAPEPQTPEYNQPLATSYYDLPPAFVDNPFSPLEELPRLSLSYLKGMRNDLFKTIKSVTGQINLAERRRANLTQEELDLLNYRKGYKQKVSQYEDAFLRHFKQRR